MFDQCFIDSPSVSLCLCVSVIGQRRYTVSIGSGRSTPAFCRGLTVGGVGPGM